jgi:hypothetical protein
MIQVGDLVRFRNKYLSANGYNPGQRRRWKKFKTFRGKQRLHRVIRLSEPIWDWKTRKWNQVATLDDGECFSVYWLRVVRKGRNADKEVSTTLATLTRNNLQKLRHVLSFGEIKGYEQGRK